MNLRGGAQASLFLALVLVSTSARADVSRALRDAREAVEDAIDAANEDTKGCREAVLESLFGIKKDVRDLEDRFSRGAAEDTLDRVRGAVRRAEPDCGRKVRRDVSDAAESLEEALSGDAGRPVEPAAPPPAPPAPPSADCLDLMAMLAIADVPGIAQADRDMIAAQRTASCAPGAGDGGDFRWPTGNQAHFAGPGEWRYPNGTTFKFGSGEYRYPDGTTVYFASDEWRYPSGSTARFPSGEWRDPTGTTVTVDALVARVCQKAGEAKCLEWRGYINERSGWWADLAVIEMVWGVLR